MLNRVVFTCFFAQPRSTFLSQISLQASYAPMNTDPSFAWGVATAAYQVEGGAARETE